MGETIISITNFIHKQYIIVYCKRCFSEYIYLINIFNRKDYDFIFGTVVRNYTKDKIIKSKFNPKKEFTIIFDFTLLIQQVFFLKKKIYNKIGNYNLKFKCSADYDLYFRLIKKWV